MQIKKIIPIFVSAFLFFTFCQGQFIDVNKGKIIAHSHLAPNLLGGGVGILDVNNDGWEDIYLTGGLGQDALLLNNGDLTFDDISINSFIFQHSRPFLTNAVTTGDINNDGFDDIFLSTVKGQSSVLLLNTGNGTFQNITNSAGLDSFTEWSMGATFLDINNDGFLDIYVINYIDEFNAILDENGEVIGFDHLCSPNRLFVNNGNTTFTERAEEYNLDSQGCGLAVATIDVNNDCISDLFVANDFGEWIIPNELYLGGEFGAPFSEQSQLYNLQDSIYGMGVATADINGDLKNDFIVTNIGAGRFKVSDDLTNLYKDLVSENVYREDQIGWGVLLTDIDNDSDDDLYFSNGFISTADFIEGDRNNINRLYEYRDGEYIDITEASEFIELNDVISRGSATCDLNNDGRIDIINVNIDRTQSASESAVNIYLNQNDSQHNWISITLNGENHTSALGSSVTVYLSEIEIKKQFISGGSHASQSSKRMHFGLGSSNSIDSIKVEWFDQTTTSFRGIESNQHLLIEKGSPELAVLNCDEENWGCPPMEERPLSFQNKMEFSIYPNPAAGLVTINSLGLDQSYTIYDITGNVVHHGVLSQQSQVIDLSLLKSGIYHVEINNAVKKLLLSDD